MSEQTKGFIATNWFKLFLVGIVVLLFAIWFYREAMLDSCIADAESGYSEERDALCAAEKKGANCDFISSNPVNPMVIFNVTALGAQRDQSIDACYRRYSFQ